MAAMSITKNAILNLSNTLPQVPSLFIRNKVSRVCFSSEGFHASEDFKRRQDFNRGVKDEKTPEMEMAEKMENMRDGMDKTKQAAKDMKSMKDKTSDMAGKAADKAKEGKDKAADVAQDMKKKTKDTAESMADKTKENMHDTKEATKEARSLSATRPGSLLTSGFSPAPP